MTKLLLLLGVLALAQAKVGRVTMEPDVPAGKSARWVHQRMSQLWATKRTEYNRAWLNTSAGAARPADLGRDEARRPAAALHLHDRPSAVTRFVKSGCRMLPKPRFKHNLTHHCVCRNYFATGIIFIPLAFN